MSVTNFDGKRVLVTGAASGIGLAAATLFAENGAAVAINHLPGDERGDESVKLLSDKGLSVIAAPGDVSDVQDAGRMTTQAISDLGGLDALINNAGTSNTVKPVDFADLEAMDEAFWGAIMSTNLLGPYRCARAAAGALRQSEGAIVNTASVAGLGRRGSSIAYGASKAALINLTSNLAKALAPKVRVNAVAPGFVNSGWTAPWPEERRQNAINQSLLKRAVEPEDIASAMLFLAGHRAVNGQTLVVDCGSEA